jgi:hypothetical protein
VRLPASVVCEPTARKGRRMALYRRLARHAGGYGPWRLLIARITGRRGTVSAADRPAATAQYRWRPADRRRPPLKTAPAVTTRRADPPRPYLRGPDPRPRPPPAPRRDRGPSAQQRTGPGRGGVDDARARTVDERDRNDLAPSDGQRDAAEGDRPVIGVFHLRDGRHGIADHDATLPPSTPKWDCLNAEGAVERPVPGQLGRAPTPASIAARAP